MFVKLKKSNPLTTNPMKTLTPKMKEMLEEYRETCFHKEKAGFMNPDDPNEMMKVLNAENVGDVQYKLMPKIEDLFVKAMQVVGKEAESDLAKGVLRRIEKGKDLEYIKTMLNQLTK